PDGRIRRHARDQPRGSQGPLRRRARLYRDRDGRRHAQPAGGATVAARKRPENAHRLREEKRRNDGLRDRRYRPPQPPRNGTAEGRRGLRGAGGAPPRHRPGDPGLPRWPDDDDDAGPRRCAAAYPRWENAPDRDYRPEAPRAAARDA